MSITQGVPQGSVLGPLFYIIYANDLPNIIKNCEIALYADDTVLFTANESFDVSVRKMQEDLVSLSNWCNVNGILANTDKSKLMVFGSPVNLKKIQAPVLKLCETKLQVVTSYKYLGMTLDSNLNYNLHVKRVISSESGKLKQFQLMRNFLSVRAAVLVYKGTILPLLEYGDVLLSSATLGNRKKLQTLQNKCLRCALNKGIETSSKDLHSEANILKLKFRREQHLMNFMFDWSQDPKRLKAKTTSRIITRSHGKKLLKLKKPSTEKFKRSMAYKGPRQWNNLSNELHSVSSKHQFKTLVKAWITDKATVLDNL